MTKHEFNAAVLTVCGGGLVATMIGLLIGGELGGLFLIACMFALLAAGRCYARRHRGNEKHAPSGPTAGEVARLEMLKKLAGWPDGK